MDGFEKHWETHNNKLPPDQLEFIEVFKPVAKAAWLESAKQCAQGHPDIFEMGVADGRKYERAQIVSIIRKAAAKAGQVSVQLAGKYLIELLEGG